MNSLNDLKNFMFAYLVSVFVVPYCVQLIIFLMTGEIQELIFLREIFYYITSIMFAVVMLLLDKERYKESKVLYVCTYSTKVYKKYKFIQIVLSVFLVSIAVAAVYSDIYLRYWKDDRIVNKTEIKKKCCCKKVNINGSTYYCFKKDIKNETLLKQDKGD